MRSWRVFASSDGSTWTMLDSRTDTTDLNGPYRVGTFKVNCPNWYRYFKIQMTDQNHAGNFAMTVAGIEFFGDLIGQPKPE
jgi:hypothetical protein